MEGSVSGVDLITISAKGWWSGNPKYVLSANTLDSTFGSKALDSSNIVSVRTSDTTLSVVVTSSVSLHVDPVPCSISGVLNGT